MIGLKLLHRTVLPGIMALVLMGTASQAQQSYPTPEEAASALAAAAKSGPRDILKVLGRAADDIVSSGDEVADADIRARFVSMYDAKHAIKAEANKKATLLLGPDDFPFPIPLVNTKAGWEFDTDEGRIEVLRRRIGRNELDAIQTALAYVDAQNEYADKDRGQGAGVYAQRFLSTPGKKDGLFWRDDNDPSPLGALVAEASAEGYKPGEGPAPYHGYYFRILKGQGPDAPGGALNYVVKDKMIGGFGLIAWPAEYGNSGVMTFVVNHAGTVYEKDLGRRTDFVAPRMTLFDPDQTWKKADAGKP
ncbi:DUF2950 domain-containing protein [Bradyrhizobium japonicum]|uniref:DUF2950 domain-containing protein n=1 Tax=Bradyrhizobium japonicum TaxID=375 RepID=UPI000456AB3D|nr:DUF2950 domain-containing protein [Bradyrhizobium japonicum]AHY53384.1 hypothetical protein BJS_00763 [Bradyrhizobium japonicum SEMIA 5079]MBR0914163.1 DUF2950 domain-containing protein [Bradyrhizobium japonicum]MCD9106098.1 DUF2950 domain-containing protein [Bradyrhizobium japonicum]MCD9259439.1 DUF2950 domain-containing protein [Bradyrhizobium japonicum SEMIA 5079]MCD9817227.1 DUF2950 domain-containing protein [Bradyrhizobium japonicum]